MSSSLFSRIASRVRPAGFSPARGGLSLMNPRRRRRNSSVRARTSRARGSAAGLSAGATRASSWRLASRSFFARCSQAHSEPAATAWVWASRSSSAGPPHAVREAIPRRQQQRATGPSLARMAGEPTTAGAPPATSGSPSPPGPLSHPHPSAGRGGNLYREPPLGLVRVSPRLLGYVPPLPVGGRGWERGPGGEGQVLVPAGFLVALLLDRPGTLPE